MSETKIEWTERTWNPIVGCTVHSPGCKNCYAMRMAARLEAMAVKADGTGNPGLIHYVGTTEPSRRGAVWTGKIGIAGDEAFTAPLRRKKPTDYFVNSMSDLFHVSVPFEVVDRVFAVMALSPQHTYKILTKRSKRMREYLNGLADCDWQARLGDTLRRSLATAPGGRPSWPLPNVWLGVSVEDQTRADERIPDLLATPAAVRFLSCEPLLGPVRLDCKAYPESHCEDWLRGDAWDDVNGGLNMEIWGSDPGPKIDWVIAGGESGPGARPMHPNWARSLRDQCVAAGVPFHFKQWGEWAPRDMFDNVGGLKAADLMLDGTRCVHSNPMTSQLALVGKKRAGRLLDGVEHNGFPAQVNGEGK